MIANPLHEVQSIIVGRAVVRATLRALQEFGSSELEGLVLWLGHVDGRSAQVIEPFVPNQRSVTSEDGLGYFVDGETLFEMNRALAERRLRLIAQVHSHPGEAYHSEADDRFAIVTADGGLSLVVPDFGHAPEDPTRWAVYRLDRGFWQALQREEVRSLLRVIEEP